MRLLKWLVCFIALFFAYCLSISHISGDPLAGGLIGLGCLMFGMNDLGFFTKAQTGTPAPELREISEAEYQSADIRTRVRYWETGQYKPQPAPLTDEESEESYQKIIEDIRLNGCNEPPEVILRRERMAPFIRSADHPSEPQKPKISYKEWIIEESRKRNRVH